MDKKLNKSKGRKGGKTDYQNIIKLDLFSTLKALKDYYKGKSTEERKN